MKAILPVAGRGERLRPLTDTVPKALIDIGGKPLIARVLRGLAAAGFTRALLILGYRGDQIQSALGDGSALGIRLEYTWQDQSRKGTAAAAMAGRDWAGGDPFALIWGDTLTDPAHYRLLAQRWREWRPDALIGMNWLERIDRGAAIVRDGDRIDRIIEKPGLATAPSHWNQAGSSLYGPLFWEALDHIQPSARGEYEVTDAVQHMIEAGHDVRGIELHGYNLDIGSFDELERARQLVASGGWHRPA